MFLYWFRVITLSFEALVLFAAGIACFLFESELNALAASLSVNEEFQKYIVVAPVGLSIWIVKESRLLLQEDKESIKILTNWPDYPMLKIHVWVALIYCFIFTTISIVPWATKSVVSDGIGLVLFLTALSGQLIVATSIYIAQIKVRELLSHMSRG